MHEFQILMYITIFTPNLNCHFADNDGAHVFWNGRHNQGSRAPELLRITDLTL
jgi:hypothetical protein